MPSSIDMFQVPVDAEQLTRHPALERQRLPILQRHKGIHLQPAADDRGTASMGAFLLWLLSLPHGLLNLPPRAIEEAVQAFHSTRRTTSRCGRCPLMMRGVKYTTTPFQSIGESLAYRLAVDLGSYV
jgi:hypothetical protein